MCSFFKVGDDSLENPCKQEMSRPVVGSYSAGEAVFTYLPGLGHRFTISTLIELTYLPPCLLNIEHWTRETNQQSPMQ
jgi:hypothetical protein